MERANQDKAPAATAQYEQKATAAAGVGETDGEEHQTGERDAADGRRPWEFPPVKPKNPDDPAKSPHSRDASGMDTRQVIARFEAERQALALMDHPSIAKVLDAGATETGRPYFVMELVTGVSITEYCDKNNLSTKDRLALFLQVCHAVQHAHQKGIIHRDIKPSNVMVTHHDGKPVPKVIDFGIAKATNQRLTEKTLFTRYAHIIGTPAYMSPEQAELSDLDIDTRSDIYSLGVLLYELLTGTTPFSEEELRKAGYIEMQRVIREQEPVKPSTRIRTAQAAQSPWRGRPALACRGHPARDSRAGRPRHKEQGQDALATGRCTPYRRLATERAEGYLRQREAMGYPLLNRK